MNRKPTRLQIIGASTAVVVTAGAVVFGLSTRGTDDTADAATPTPSQTSAVTEPAETPAPTEEAAAAPSGETAVSTAPIVDDVFGHTITPTAIVRDFTASGPAPAGGEYVLVNVDVTAGNTYYGGFSESELGLAGVGSDEDYPATAKTSVIADDMRAAGYTPFEDLASGASGSGWVAFILDDKAADLELQYKRLAYQTSDGAAIDKATFATPLTAS